VRPICKGAILVLVLVLGAVAVASAQPGSARRGSWCIGSRLRPHPGDLTRIRAATLCLINRERVRHGEAPLRLNRHLALAAQRHSASMARFRYFAHAGPAGETPLARIRAAGYLGRARTYAVGENIAWGTLRLSTPQAIVAAWMASPGHRANILDRRFRDTAVGVAIVSVRGSRHAQLGGVYTEDFGARGGRGRSEHSS